MGSRCLSGSNRGTSHILGSPKRPTSNAQSPNVKKSIPLIARSSHKREKETIALKKSSPLEKLVEEFISMGFDRSFLPVFSDIAEREYISEGKLLLNGFRKNVLDASGGKQVEQGFKHVKKVLKTRVNDNLRLRKNKIIKKAANFFQEISVLRKMEEIGASPYFCDTAGVFMESAIDSPEISSLEIVYKAGLFTFEEILKIRSKSNWINNDSLQDFNSIESYSLGEIMLFLKHILEALVTLHQSSIFLNELRPANLYYNPNLKRFQIGDFSNARVIRRLSGDEVGSEDAIIRGSKFLFSTPHDRYSSPEKIRVYNFFREKNKPNCESDDTLQIDPLKTDLFSLGVLLEDMLEGRPSKYKNVNLLVEKLKISDWKLRPSAASLLKEVDQMIDLFNSSKDWTYDEDNFIELLMEKQNEKEDFSRIYKGFDATPPTIEDVNRLEAEYLKALKKYQGNEESNLNLFINLRFKLGKAYADIGEHHLALEHFSKTLDYEKIVYGLDDHQSICLTMMEKALILGRIGEHSSALEILKELLGLQLRKQDETPETINFTKFIIAKQTAKKGDVFSAKKELETLLSIQQKLRRSENNVSAAVINCELAKLNYKIGNYQISREKSSNALTTLSRLYKSDENSIVTWALTQAARLNYKIGRHKLAEEQFERILRVKIKQCNSEEHPLVLEIMQEIGKMWAYLGAESLAIEQFMKILEVRKKISKSSENQHVLSTLVQIAKLHTIKNQPGFAIEIYNEILEKQRKIFNSDMHPLIANTMHSLGLHYVVQGDYKSALGFFEQAFNIRRKIFGSEEIPIVINTNIEIGRTLSLLENFSIATEKLRRSLDGHLKYYKMEDHIDVSYIYVALAEHMERMGGLNKAMEYFLKALQIQRSIFKNVDHPATAFLLFAIGNLKGSMGDHLAALEYFKLVEQMRKNFYKNKRTQGMLSVEFAKAQQLVCLNRFDEALGIFLEVLNSRKILYKGEDNLLVASVYHELGLLYQKISKLELALQNLERAYEIEKHLFKNGENLAMAATLHAIASVQAQLGSIPIARSIFLQVIEIEKKIYNNDDHPAVRKTINNMKLAIEDMA